MKQVTIAIVLMFAALLATPVAAVTYSDEYYKFGNISTTLDPHNDVVEYLSKQSVYFDFRYLYITTIELRRQTILMEKQNELLEEQNSLTKMQMGMKLQCTKKGLASYGGCLEYAWVEQSTPIPTVW